MKILLKKRYMRVLVGVPQSHDHTLSDVADIPHLCQFHIAGFIGGFVNDFFEGTSSRQHSVLVHENRSQSPDLPQLMRDWACQMVIE